MKKQYISPTSEVAQLRMETLLGAASPSDQYSIGGDDSKWPEEGGIIDDHGDGPGVSGAKGTTDTEFWDL